MDSIEQHCVLSYTLARRLGGWLINWQAAVIRCGPPRYNRCTTTTYHSDVSVVGVWVDEDVLYLWTTFLWLFLKPASLAEYHPSLTTNGVHFECDYHTTCRRMGRGFRLHLTGITLMLSRITLCFPPSFKSRNV